MTRRLGVVGSLSGILVGVAAILGATLVTAPGALAGQHGGGIPQLGGVPHFPPGKPYGTYNQSGTWTSSNGSSGTYNRSVVRGPGRTDKTSTWTNQNGQTTTRNVDNSWNAQTGTGVHDVTVTGPNGKTWTQDETITRNANGSYTIQGTDVGPNGKTTNFTDTVTGKPGNWSGSGSYTTSSGGSGTFQQTVTGAPGTRSNDLTMTNGNGQTATRDINSSWGKGQWSRTNTTTNFNGQTSSTTVNGQVASHNDVPQPAPQTPTQ